MIPIRDTIPSRRVPFVMYGIIACNALVFFYELGLSPRELHLFLHHYGIVPARYSDPGIAAHFSLVDQAVPFVSSMFLHGGWLHILGNMWSLWIFGDNVEDWFGHVGFAVFYVLCGVASGLLHLFFNWASPLPTIGASGAVAGVMGAYFLLYPRARILTLVPIFFFITFIELPAFVFLGLWFLLQFLSGTAAAASGVAGGIAWWAHVGGFVAGAAAVFLLGGARPRKLRGRRPTMKPLWDKVDQYW
ncbi:MAG: rhomboid family intramembrane serine protease [Deferrisomatales bacterium]|nr:rhomboid family intramembrane serine protease [Deferrisomatales bacterium]